MTHFDQHTLELFVLRAQKVEGLREAIEEHLAECIGCRLLADEIASFHRELQDEAAKLPLEKPTSDKLLKRRQHFLEPQAVDYGSAVPYMPQTRIDRVFTLVRNHPIVSGVASLSLLVAAALGIVFMINSSKRSGPKNTNPDYTFLNVATGTLEVYNDRNERLWSKPLPDARDKYLRESTSRNTSHMTVDLDGDGHKEVITTYSLSGNPPIQPGGLHVFDGAGQYKGSYRFHSAAAFNGTSYAALVEIGDGSPMLIDATDNPLKPDIFVIANNNRSPCALVRMNTQGVILGEYWHYGAIIGMHLRDINGDGSNELTLYGINDVNDDKELSKPVIVVLDPRKVVGKTESSRSRGFGKNLSAAEIYYIQLPLSDLNIVEHRNALVTCMMEDSLDFRFDCTTHLSKASYDFEYLFTPDFQPLSVKSKTETTEYYARLLANGTLSRPLDNAYLDSLKGEIRYWNGRELTKSVVQVQPLWQ